MIMKKIIVITLLSFAPIMMFAQASGGQIRRPKPSPSTNTPRRSSGVMTQSEKERIIENIRNNMVYVEGGTYTMWANNEYGSDIQNRNKQCPPSTIMSFYIGKYEVTQEEWIAVMGSNPSIFKGRKRPVDNVCWDDCVAFVNKLNSLTGENYRLPTEAEWEYAARGGLRSHGYNFSGSDDISKVAWYLDKWWSKGEKSLDYGTHNVGLLQPNELGIYDMSGNVDEWCYPYGNKPGNTFYSSRGGGWNSGMENCRISDWGQCQKDVKSYNMGLRIIR